MLHADYLIFSKKKPYLANQTVAKAIGEWVMLVLILMNAQRRN